MMEDGIKRSGHLGLQAGALLTLSLVATAAFAAEPAVRLRLDWAELSSRGRLLGGEVIDGAAGALPRLRVRSSTSGPTIPLVVLERPPVHSGRYAIRGELTAMSVEGVGYLELWNIFPAEGRFFSRTMAEVGPLRSIRGSEGPRPFLVPFDAQKPVTPERLELNVVLPGGGSVILGPLELVEVDSSESLWALVAGSTARPWTLFVGPVMGTLLGALGAAIGILSSLRRGRRLASGLMTAGAACSILCLLTGLVLLARGGTFFDASGLLFVGALGTTLLVSLRRSVLQRFVD